VDLCDANRLVGTIGRGVVRGCANIFMRGGYLVTDDMWGSDAWEVFKDTMNRVLPGRDIPDNRRDRSGDACHV